MSSDKEDCCDMTDCGPGPGQRGPTDKVDSPFMQKMVDQIGSRYGTKNDIHSGMSGNEKQDSFSGPGGRG